MLCIGGALARGRARDGEGRQRGHQGRPPFCPEDAPLGGCPNFAIRKDHFVKRAFLVITILALALVGTVGVAGAKGPANRATGFVEFDIGQDRQRAAEFDAHAEQAHREAKGSFTYLDWIVDEYVMGIEVDVQCVNVVDNEAWFAGPVVDTRPGFHTSWPGTWMAVYVEDAGDPGAYGDDLGWSQFADEASACAWVAAGEVPASPDVLTVNGGNIKVHYYE